LSINRPYLDSDSLEEELIAHLSKRGWLVLHCFIRPIAIGRETYVQGGPGLQAFFKACLLNSEEPKLDDLGAPGKEGELQLSECCLFPPQRAGKQNQ